MEQYGNLSTYNLETVLKQNIINADFYKNDCAKLNSWSAIIDQIFYQVDYVEPWLAGNARGPSTAFCLLYRLFLLKPSEDEVRATIDHEDSVYIRAVGFLYLRYVADPRTLWSWLGPYCDDTEEIQPSGPNGPTVSVGDYVRDLLLEQYYYETIFPRIPKRVEDEIQAGLKAHGLPTKGKGNGGCGGADRRGADMANQRPASVKASLSVAFGQRAPNRAGTKAWKDEDGGARRAGGDDGGARRAGADDSGARRAGGSYRSRSRSRSRGGDRDRDRGGGGGGYDRGGGYGRGYDSRDRDRERPRDYDSRDRDRGGGYDRPRNGRGGGYDARDRERPRDYDRGGRDKYERERGYDGRGREQDDRRGGYDRRDRDREPARRSSRSRSRSRSGSRNPGRDARDVFRDRAAPAAPAAGDVRSRYGDASGKLDLGPASAGRRTDEVFRIGGRR